MLMDRELLEVERCATEMHSPFFANIIDLGVKPDTPRSRLVGGALIFSPLPLGSGTTSTELRGPDEFSAVLFEVIEMP